MNEMPLARPTCTGIPRGFRLFMFVALLAALSAVPALAQTPHLIGSFNVDFPGYGIAIDSSGTVTSVNYFQDSVSRYTASGTFLSSYSLTGGPFLANIAPDGNLYVSLFNSGQVAVLNPTTGATITSFASMSFPSGITFGNGDVYVAAYSNSITTYSLTGTQLSTFPTTSGNAPIDLAFGPDGNLYLARLDAGIQVYSTGGTLLNTIAPGITGPIGLRFDAFGRLYLTDTNNGDLDVFNTSGVLLGQATGLAGPYGVAIAPNGTIYVENQQTSQIFIYSLGLGTMFAQTPGLTPNQHAVAAYLDHFSTQVSSGNFGALTNAMSMLFGTPALPDALSQLSPQSLEIFHHISFDYATFANQQLGNHLANRRDGLTGFDSSQLTFTDSTLDPTLAQINGRLLAWNPNSTPGLMSDVVDPLFGATDPKDMKDLHEITPADRWSTFIAGNVVLADLNHTTDLAHQDFTTGSVTAGADYQLDDHFTVGALFAYGHTDATLDHIGSKATVDTYSPGVYASYVDGGWYGNGLFSYGYNAFSENRNIAIGALSGTNSGSTSGNQYAGNLTGGYEFKLGAWKIGPTASVQYVNLGIDSINESGPTALNIDSQNAESLRTQFGLTARYATKVDTCYGPMLFTPHFSALWQHECLDDSEGITSQFSQVAAGSFTVQTSSPDRDSAFLDLGLDAQVDKELTLFVDYETEAGQSHFFAQSIQGGLKIGF